MARALTNIAYGEKLDKPRQVPGAPTGTEATHETKTINAGEEVDRSKFSDEEWRALLAAGAVTEDDNVTVSAGTPAASAGGSALAPPEFRPERSAWEESEKKVAEARAKEAEGATPYVVPEPIPPSKEAAVQLVQPEYVRENQFRPEGTEVKDPSKNPDADAGQKATEDTGEEPQEETGSERQRTTRAQAAKEKQSE